ncbi:MAG: hypothetical protein NVS1B10_04340 [Candidatus Saccharimonadales bacterium]
MGGNGAPARSTVYYAKLNADGSTGTWTTNTNPLPLAQYYSSSVVANGYIYELGGSTGSAQSTVYYAKLNADGSTGTWTTNTNALPQTIYGASAVVANGYVYEIGGYNGTSPQSTVYYAKLNADGSTGTWNTNTNALPQTLYNFSSVVANGYVYGLGGYNGTSPQSTVYYASTERLQIGGSLDLVGLSGGNLFDPGGSGGTGSVGGTLTAGDTNIVGNLQVSAQANFSQSVNINNGLSISGNQVLNSSTGDTTIELQNTGMAGTISTNTGANYTTAPNVVDDASIGTIAWTNPGNAAVEDGISATNSGNGATTHYLKATSFGFTIPSNATILGVVAEAKVSCGCSAPPPWQDTAARLVKANVIGTTDRSSATSYTSSLTYLSHGGTTDLWGTTLTPSDVNNSGFGFALASIKPGGVVAGVSVDAIRIIVYYSAPTSSSWITGLQASTGKYKISASNALGTSDLLSLDNTGGLRIAGSLTTSATPDISEAIPSADDVTPADVVKADPKNEVHAVKSNGAYDSGTIGIVSDGTSAFKINSNSHDVNSAPPGKYLVLAGRVPVHITNEGGNVKPGDYLTTSSTPGYAMKANKAGPTIGKALGFFNNSSGTVMVQTNLGWYDPGIGSQIQGSTGSFGDLNVSGLATLTSLHVTGNSQFDGDVTVGGHVITAGTQPTATIQPSSGVGSGVTITGNDTSGTISINTGITTLSGALASFKFNKSYAATPHIVLTGQDGRSTSSFIYPSNKSTNGFELHVDSPLSNNSTYKFDYFIAQ